MHIQHFLVFIYIYIIYLYPYINMYSIYKHSAAAWLCRTFTTLLCSHTHLFPHFPITHILPYTAPSPPIHSRAVTTSRMSR